MPPSQNRPDPARDPYNNPGQLPVPGGPAPGPAYPPQASQQPPLPPQPDGYHNPPPSDPGRYDFFLQPEAKSARHRAGGLSGFAKLLLGAGALVLVLVILAVVLTVSRGNKGASPTGLTALAANQQEIIRVGTMGAGKIQSQNLKNFTSTAIASLTSDQQALVNFASRHGGTIDSRLLGSAKDPNTDRVLAAAEAASTYDATYKSAMDQMLNDYQVKLRQTGDAATVAGERELLDKDLRNARLLQQMLSQ